MTNPTDLIAQLRAFDRWDGHCYEQDFGTARNSQLPFEAATALSAAVERERVLRDLLSRIRGYVESDHDEGCELDPEWGEFSFNRNEDARVDVDDDAEPRVYPDEARCTCGNTEFLAEITTALAGETGRG